MSYIRLPDRAFTFLDAPYALPQWSSGTQNVWPYGRQRGLNNINQIGGIPTNICNQILNGINYFNVVQFTPNNLYSKRFPFYDTNVNSGIVYADDYLIWLPYNPSKGLKWMTLNLITNFAGFPTPGLENGVITNFLSRTYYKTDNICFPQGGLSCATTLGQRFPGAGKFINNRNFLTSASSGCPVGSNWGMAYVDPTSEYNTITISDGFGSGTRPFLRANNLNDLFNKTQGCGAVQIASNRIAALSSNGYANFGTLLTIYKFGINATPGNVGTCNGEITLNCFVEMQIDLQSIVGGSSGHSNVKGLWTDRHGTIACCVSNDSFRKIVIIQFPGPIVQVISGLFTGQAQSTNPYVFIYNGYVGYAYVDGAQNPYLRWSTTQIDMTYNFSLPVNPISNNVSQSNIVENISARGF